MAQVSRRAIMAAVLGLFPASALAMEGEEGSVTVEGTPNDNIRIGASPPVRWSVSTVTSLPAQGVIAVGSNSAGGETGEFNGTFSVHVGYRSAALSPGGYCQVGVGLQTLLKSAGYYNTAVGTDALKYHEVGNNQVALGAKAMYSDVTGSGSVVIGSAAGFTSQEVLSQTLIGESAAYTMPLGAGNEANVAVGQFASRSRTGGRMNVEIGQSAGDTDRRVDYCVHIGRGAGKDTPDGASLAGAIGFEASASGTGRFRIGGVEVVPEAATSLQVIADRRDASHLSDVDLERAKAIVLEARFVQYRVNARELYPGIFDSDPAAKMAWERGEKMRERVHAGVYAQEEAERLASIGVDFPGLKQAYIAGGRDNWTASYESYIPYMGAIIQEQAAKIERLEATVEELKRWKDGVLGRGE